ncbi:MAG TPA: molybdenum cofactor guanylyltransferase, partial [Clostridia bacterium]|nr:molybdenum cofactor guanylyltransferase [Clostridia bacterium]
MRKLDFSAVVLAGGASLRMGRDKAWLPAGRETFLERSLNLCRSLHPREVFISGRPGEDYSAFPYSVLLDLEPGNGPLGGIERALQAATAPLVLVLAVDLPLMTTPFLSSLLAHCDRLTGCVPRHDDRLEPLAA